jgi:gliding motility-associated-like protein
LLFLTIQSFAITGPPQILRACINSKDSTVSISWRPPSDACASFTHYSIFASYNGGAFTKIISIPLLSVSEYPHKINNSSTKWQYYLRIYTLCDGLDSLQSETLDIDIQRPQALELDSVSYDLATQNITAGWSQNPSPDTKLYKIYNFSSGNGDSIGVTTNTNFTVSYNPSTAFPVVIATLDSCNLSSVLSLPHVPTRLTGTLDSCKRQISFNWTPYQGWSTIDSQTLFVSVNNSVYIRHSATSGGANTLTYNNLYLGDRLSFYIRSYTKASSITSSSNLLTFKTRKHNAPANLYLSNVNVKQETLEVSFKVTDLNDTWKFTLHKGTNQNLLFPESQITPIGNTLDYQHVDYQVSVDQSKYYYRIEAQDKCGFTLSFSNISCNMLLEIGDKLIHNPYIEWREGVDNYELQHSNDNGSTWNTLQTSRATFNTNDYQDSSGCFRVLAFEKPNNSFNTASVSSSNTVCVQDDMTSYVVTAVNPGGDNNRFVIAGKGIDHSTSFYQVYNRWGELLVQKPTDQAWDLTYKEQIIPSDRYIYVVKLYGFRGEKKTEKGILNVIR